jgi:SAM-dependent methyltransferase
MSGILDAQQQHWNRNFNERPDMFGEVPSDPAQRALELLIPEGRSTILELGGGQGRDAFFFARSGFHVTMVDYSQVAVEGVNARAETSGLGQSVRAIQHDIREPLPFGDETFDAAFSHMLFCMALTNTEAERLSSEVWRILKPGGLNVFTVRHTGDPHYGTGIHRGEEMYEVGGFIVNFFDRAKVERLAPGFELLSVAEFEEGGMPRRLFRVTLRKPLSKI